MEKWSKNKHCGERETLFYGIRTHHQGQKINIFDQVWVSGGSHKNCFRGGLRMWIRHCAAHVVPILVAHGVLCTRAGAPRVGRVPPFDTGENGLVSASKQVAEFGLNCKKSYENTQVFVHHPKCFSVSPETSLCHSSFIFYWLRVFPLRKLNTTENSLKLHHTFPCLRCYTEWGHFPEVPLSHGWYLQCDDAPRVWGCGGGGMVGAAGPHCSAFSGLPATVCFLVVPLVAVLALVLLPPP